MNLLELAQKRCSIRKYASSPGEEEKLAYILEAGRMAPSAVNFQPWYFVIIRQEAGRAKIQECYAREWFRSAPLYIEPAVILTIGYPESLDLFEQTSKKRKTLEEIIKEETF